MLGFVEILQHFRDAIEVVRLHPLPRDELIEKTAVRELAHLHGVFHHRVTVAEDKVPGARGDRHDAEINVRREPAVERHLAFAEVPAFFQCGEVEEAEVHRLLHLVNKGRRNEHERRMGLHQPHRARPVRIGLGIKQERQELLLRHQRGGRWRAGRRGCGGIFHIRH